MIVIGVDVHKRSLTAVAVDEAGRMLDQQTATTAEGRRSAGLRLSTQKNGCGRSRIAGS